MAVIPIRRALDKALATALRRKQQRDKRYPEPVPPIRRRAEASQPKPLSDVTKARLVALAVTRAKNWSNGG